MLLHARSELAAMLLRLLRWLLLFGALIAICSFVLALLSWFDSAMPPTLTAAFFLLHLHLAPWVPDLLPEVASRRN
jgi:hypothetical protein